MDAVTPKATVTADSTRMWCVPQNMEWQKTRFPGCEAKTLLFDRETGLMTALMRFAPGAVLPDHEHVNIEQTYVLEGRLVDKEGPAEGIEAKKGEFIWREPGSRHSAWCPEGGLMLAIFQVPNKFFETDGRVTRCDRDNTGTKCGGTPARADRRGNAMDAVTPKGHQTADTHSHVVRPQNMEWQKTRFPGCEAKTLLFDRSTGLMTALMRFAPGAVLPDHEHVNIEQTYVLEGRLVDKEGPAAGIEAQARRVHLARGG